MSVSAHGRAMRLCAHVVVCRRVLHTWVCVCECAKGGLHTWLCVHWGVQGGMHECVCTWVSMGVCGCAKGGGCKVVICECVNGCKDGGACV